MEEAAASAVPAQMISIFNIVQQPHPPMKKAIGMMNKFRAKVEVREDHRLIANKTNITFFLLLSLFLPPPSLPNKWTSGRVDERTSASRID